MNESLFKIEKKKYNKSNLMYNRLSFCSYSDNKKFDSLSLKLKYSYLLIFYVDLQKLIKMKPQKLDKIKEKEKVYNTLSELYNKRFENCYDEYNKLSDVKKNKYNKKLKSKKLKVEHYDYDRWFREEEKNDEEKLDDVPLPEGDEEEVKKGKWMKI